MFKKLTLLFCVLAVATSGCSRNNNSATEAAPAKSKSAGDQKSTSTEQQTQAADEAKEQQTQDVDANNKETQKTTVLSPEDSRKVIRDTYTEAELKSNYDGVMTCLDNMEAQLGDNKSAYPMLILDKEKLDVSFDAVPKAALKGLNLSRVILVRTANTPKNVHVKMRAPLILNKGSASFETPCTDLSLKDKSVGFEADTAKLKFRKSAPVHVGEYQCFLLTAQQKKANSKIIQFTLEELPAQGAPKQNKIRKGNDRNDKFILIDEAR